MVERADVVVAGAGVVGLAVAREFARRGREVVILEAGGGVGTGASSRNSEVIHAGVYYPPDSLKARLCVDGRRRLYAFCADAGVAHRRCGKLIVAAHARERPTLDAVAARAAAAGVDDLRRLGSADIAALEPEVAGVDGLFSPSTGILDSHGFLLALQGAAEDAGAVVAFRTPATGGRVQTDRVELACGGAAPSRLEARLFVNAAGIAAPEVARALQAFPAAHVPRQRLAKGSYFALTTRAPFAHLIYPVPADGGLGVHATLDLGGGCRFGPDVEWVDAPNYDVDPGRAAAFAVAIRRYWPALPDGALAPGYAGVRAKLSGPGEPAADFVVSTPRDHGAGPVVNLFGIESPGLTASLAIAAHVADSV